MPVPAAACQASTSRNDEDDADNIAVPASDLEDIGAPAQVRAHHHHFAVMQAALAAARMALEEKPLPLHDSEDSLMVGRWLALCGQQSVHQRGDAPIAVGRSFIGHASDQRHELLIGGFAIMPARCCRPVNTFIQMRSGHAKRVGDRLHREASFCSDTCCKVGFFAWAQTQLLQLGWGSLPRGHALSSEGAQQSHERDALERNGDCFGCGKSASAAVALLFEMSG
jgi:hypothetical protein